MIFEGKLLSFLLVDSLRGPGKPKYEFNFCAKYSLVLKIEISIPRQMQTKKKTRNSEQLQHMVSKRKFKFEKKVTEYLSFCLNIQVSFLLQDIIKSSIKVLCRFVAL